MSVATAIATAYRSAVAKPSAKLQAASQLTGDVQRAVCGLTGRHAESVCACGNARVRKAPRAYLAMKMAARSGRRASVGGGAETLEAVQRLDALVRPAIPDSNLSLRTGAVLAAVLAS